MLDLDMEIDPTLGHIMTHDPDGFLVALHRDETVGFGAAHTRGKQWLLSELWVLPQHRGSGAGEAVLDKLLGYGERSGARSFMAVVPNNGPLVWLLLRHGFEPATLVYEFRIGRDTAASLATSLSGLLPNQDVTQDLLEQRGQADLDRIDRLTRKISRDIDHVFWLKDLRLNVSFVRQGSRIAGYGYGGRTQVGPVAGTTQEAALAALGCALTSALDQSLKKHLQIRIPATFTPAVEAALDSGAQLRRVFSIFGIGDLPTFDRYILGPINLP
jgi:ribosomal protein S18 acetylase RimI-like enzyme